MSVDGKLGPVALLARYHNFRADASSVDFGDEIDLQAQWVMTDWLTATVKFARFDTATPERYPDTTKAWFMLQLKL